MQLATHTPTVRPKTPKKNRSEGARPLPKKLGRYVLFDHIGRGGMADIYLASAKTDFGGGKLVCIKEVLAKYASADGYADMLIAEAKLSAKLCHANIVTVHDLGREDGSLYIAMDYVEGYDLRELLRRCAADKVPLPVEFALLIVIEMLRGLSYAHRFRGEGVEAGIVHRDVSPSNVLMNFDGEVKLCDFGIARAYDSAKRRGDTPRDPHEVDSAIAGKAGYMSPEQARGDHVDARSDVFAAGIVLWELLAGRRLYKAGPDESLLDVARKAAIPELPTRDLDDEARLFAIVAKALARSPEERFGSAADMRCELEDYAARARMLASPLRFGEWLLENFGRDVVTARRSRERALRALELGPVASFSPVVTPKPVEIKPVLEPLPLPEPAPETALAAAPRPAMMHRRPGAFAYSFALLLLAFAVFVVTAR